MPWRLASRPRVTPVAVPSRLAKRRRGRKTAQQVTAQVAVHGRDHIVRLKRVACADADGLVAALAEGAAQPSPLLPERDHTLVKGAREAHPVVEFQSLIPAQSQVQIRRRHEDGVLHSQPDNPLNYLAWGHVRCVNHHSVVCRTQGRQRPLAVAAHHAR